MLYREEACFSRAPWRQVLELIAEERRRAREQGKDLYVILDNFGSHRALRRWEERQRGPGKLHLVWLPVEAPWLNRVERFFRDLEREVLDNSAFGGVRELREAVYRYAEWWNAHRARPLCSETALVNA